MYLEVISRKPESGSHKAAGSAKENNEKPKLVFVHGICVGAWIWDEFFMPYFANRGYECYALSLRGHGESEGKDRIQSWTLADYTDDLDEVVKSLDGPVVVIGHSLGGAVVQDWLRAGRARAKAKGAALLASVPPWGLAYSAVRMATCYPQLYQEIARMLFMGTENINNEVMRKALFSKDVTNAVFESFLDKICDESLIVSSEVQGVRPFSPMPWDKIPSMYVAGAEDDRFIPPEEVYRTAAYYGVEACIIKDLAHSVMIDANWRQMADSLAAWLEQTFAANEQQPAASSGVSVIARRQRRRSNP